MIDRIQHKKSIKTLKESKDKVKKISMIRSFEKKPAKKGKPQRLKLATTMRRSRDTTEKNLLPLNRISWEPNLIKIKKPHLRNRRDLKRACLTM